MPPTAPGIGRNRGDIDNRTAALALHVGKHRPAREHHAEYVDVDDFAAVLDTGVAQFQVVVNRGVVDQDVDAAEAVEDLFRHRVELLLAGHVGADSEGLALAIDDFLLDHLGLLVARVHHADCRAFLDEAQRVLAADALRPSGYDRYLVLESHNGLRRRQVWRPRFRLWKSCAWQLLPTSTRKGWRANHQARWDIASLC